MAATGPKEASEFTKLRLLTWKNFLQQWRHRWQTLAEVGLPVLTMALVLILRWQISPECRDTFLYPPVSASTLNHSTTILLNMRLTRLTFAYSPESPVLEDVIRSSAVNLVRQNLRELFPSLVEAAPDLIDLLPPGLWNQTLAEELLKRIIRVDAYNNSDQLNGLYIEEETTRVVLAAIQFDDSLYGATELPKNISYSMRFPERPRNFQFTQRGGRSWRTDLLFPVFDTPGPRSASSPQGGRDPGYVNEMFIALQHSVSMELVSRLSDVDLRQYHVSVQRFPYPSYLEDFAIEVLQVIFPSFLMMSFCYTAVNIAKSVTLEKEMQLKESMKIMGLPTWLHWTAWFCKQFTFLMIVTVLIVILLKIPWFTTEEGISGYSVFTNTPWTVLTFFIGLYSACTIFFCFMLSGFFSKASTASLFTGLIWFVTYTPSFLLTIDISYSPAVQAITCLSINSAMSYGFGLMLAAESSGGMQWGSFMDAPSTDVQFVFGHVVIMLAVDCVLYMLIALYLEQVLPGAYGIPRPWYFPLQRTFWFPDSNRNNNTIVPAPNTYEVVKENDPINYSAGVQISNLTKVFGKNVAVNELSLNVYEGQITVLLGHNGAGKSTTISMLTGNIKPSYGTVILGGYNLSTQLEAARTQLGLCPQHNVIFDDLTVEEHIEFFSRLKGYSGSKLKTEIDMLIEKLELQEKRKYHAGGLSGGQKRRLAVGVALSGGTRVVLLDEPTSGMDPSSRRALWELLQKEKKDRSIILTTHFMDEADVLGDRVAIMAKGQLQCVGSPYFLKRHYGVGYTLVVVKDEYFDVEECTKLIQKYIIDAYVKEDRGTEVTYNLPNEYSYCFEKLLIDLEANVNNLRFKNYGLTATTLEDVFMKVGSDTETTMLVPENDNGTASSETTSEDLLRYDTESNSQEYLETKQDGVTGFRLLWQQIAAVWLKLLLVWTRSPWLMAMQILVPLFLMIMTLTVLNYITTLNDQIFRRELTLNEGFVRTETLLSYEGTVGGLAARAAEAYAAPFAEADPNLMTLEWVESQTPGDYYLEKGQDLDVLTSMRHRNLIGASFNDSAAVAWFSNFGYHDIAISLAGIHAALLRAHVPDASLVIYNHPLEATYADQTDQQTLVSMMAMQLSSGIGSSIGIISAVFVMFYIKERVTRAKLLQKASGIQPAVLWGSASIIDWVWFEFACIGFVITCAAYQVVGLSTTQELGRMYLCLMVYGAAMLPLIYIFSYFFEKPATGFTVLFFMHVLLGVMGSQIVATLQMPGLDTEHIAEIMDAILQFFPLYSFIVAVRNLNQIGLTKHSCMMACDYYSTQFQIDECTMETMCEHLPSCCMDENPYFYWNEPGVGKNLTLMFISCVIFWSILMIFEYRLPQKIFNREMKPPPYDELSHEDVDVKDETRHAESISSSNLNKHNLVTKKLTKYYGKNLAVNQISFTVGDDECFGLLGVNGAGKTSTFKMLMGDETISSGDAFVQGHSVKTNIGKVHEHIGYCPQFDAIFEELTGRETLQLFGLLRGLRRELITSRALVLADKLGFIEHLDKQVYQYSGGNKRKLSTAIALLGSTRLVFLDEPTTGVDPAAKRQVWRAVRRTTRAGRGVVLTSHSMEECEALCSRLTIMVNGRFHCLGTPQHLKNKFSEGFTLTIKISTDENKPISEQVDAVKYYVNFHFHEPKLMEEYQGLLTYYLSDSTMAWSRMFGIMERAREVCSLEDYSIAQTTLEQIFLQFTKYQRTDNTTPR